MIYVDDIREYNPIHIGHGKMQVLWCHMWTDGSEKELIDFAEEIGLRAKWIQKKLVTHFDLTPNKRALAIQKGAIASSLRDHFQKTKSE